MMNNLRKYLLLILLCSISMTVVSQSNNVRSFYLRNINVWLGNTTTENTILNYAAGNSVNYIIFYDLSALNYSNAAQMTKLASFLSRARTQYGITQMGASGEIASFFSNYIIPYNNSRTSALEKFDVFDFEFEYWVPSSISSLYCARYLSPNGYSCDTAGAWAFSWKEFKKVDSLAARYGAISEYYLGWPTRAQMQQVASVADRILLHAYRPTDVDLYSYSRNRLIDAASLNHPVTIICIFSSEPGFMGPWLQSHPITQPYQTYSNSYAAETGAWKSNIDLQGYTWFTYTTMPATTSTQPATASITAAGATSFCTGGSVTLTANTGSAYLWTPGGAVTRSIVASQAGSYTVRVTNASGVNATSTPVVVSVNTSIPAPTISANGPTTFCSGGNVILTSSAANSYSWSSGQTTQAITVTTGGSYSVTVYSGSCQATSAPTTISNSGSANTPVISANSSLNMCPGSVVTLTSTAAPGYYWSTGATTQSIVVNATGSYWVQAYSGPNCFSRSLNTTVNLLAAPATPTISASGPLSLTAANPTVTLTSSAASTYSWSTGAISQSIVVNSQGSYRVTITGTSGCAATSSSVTVTANGCTPPPVPAVTLSGSNIILIGQSVVLTSSLAGGYLWSTGALTRSITVSTAGTYSVRAYNAGSCFSTSLPIVIYSIAAVLANPVGKIASTHSFTAYPNPSSTRIVFSFNADVDKDYTLKIFDVSGREIESNVVHALAGDNNTELNVSEYSKGMYFAILIGDEENKSLKILVE